MQYYTIFLILYLYFNQARGDLIRNYLANRLQFVNEELNRFQQSPKDQDHAQREIAFGDAKIVRLVNKTEAHTFPLFDRNYLLTDNELLYLASADNKYILTSLKRFPEMSDEIAFIKTMDCNGIGFMFVCFVHDTVSHIYRFANNTLEPRQPIQTIKTINKLTDATFFINNGSLYLVISSVLGVSMAPVNVYKWEESHFDIVDKVYVDGAVALSHFPNLNSEIVVVLRNNEFEDSNTYVYEFNGNKLSKIQILDDIKSTHFISFVHHNFTHLVVFNDAPTSTLYRWSNNEFHLLDRFSAEQLVQQVFLDYFDDTTLIATATKKNINVFTMFSDKIQHLKTQTFALNFTKILNMQIAEFQGEKVIFLLVLSDDHTLNFMVIPMTLNKIEIVSSIQESDDLQECMKQLEDILEDNKKVKNVEEHTASFSHKNEKIVSGNNSHIANASNPAEAVLRQNQHQEIPMIEFAQHYLRIQNDLDQLEQEAASLQPSLGNLFKNDIVVVTGKLVIQGGLNAERLSANSIRTKKLNGIEWEPEKWLTRSSDQIITTPLVLDNLKVKNFQVSPDNELFKDMLVASGNQTLFGVMNVGSVKALNIFAPRINDVAMQSVYLRSAPVKITGNKSFNNVNIDDIHLSTLNGKNASEIIKLFGDPKALKYEFQPVVTVKNLEVETINDVSWRNFSQSVFRIGANQTIRGDIKLSRAKVQFLQPNFLQGVNVSQLLTTSTPQTVHSTIHFGSVDAPNVQAEKINGLDFVNDVATVRQGVDTLISGPVTTKNIHIAGNLIINGTVGKFYKQNHIVGTHERDLLQIYNNKVKINGDLHVRNINMAHDAKLFINGNEFNQAHFNEYWLKTTNQEILVHFEAQNGISTPHLITNLLNDIPIDDYMLNSNVASYKPTTYVFENVTIAGNVLIDQHKQHQPDLQRLNAEAVKLNGTYVVRGLKQFDGKITVENLKADVLNSVPTKELVTQGANNIIGSKTIKNLTVRNVNANNLTMMQLNGVELDDLKSRVVFIDEPTILNNVDFANITVNNLFATKINTKLFNEYLLELNQLHLMETLNKLEIKGNTTISKADGVIYINNVNMPGIIGKMNHKENEPVQANINFDGKVHIKELFVRQINDINMESLLDVLYYRMWPQNITARHSFKYLHAPNVFTPQINNIRTTHLINANAKQPQLLKVDNGIRLTNAKFLRSLFTNCSNCNINEAIASIQNIPKRVWQSVIVDNITLIDTESSLSRLLNYAVNAKKDNIIQAAACLNHVYAESVFNRKQINGIDLQQIVNDALTYNTTDQVVTGIKEFTKLQASDIYAEDFVEIPIINTFDIVQLDQSVLDKNANVSSILGRKTFFGGVQADHLQAPVASGVIPENLLSLTDLRLIPKATFDDLTISNNLNLGVVNNQKFVEFLDDRLLLNAGHDQITTANYYFEMLQLNGKTTIPNINDIEIDDIVFDEGLQVINSPKKFTQQVEVQGDATIEVLNGFPVTEFYQQSILLQEEAHILANITLLAPSHITGDIQAKSINGLPFDHINELLHSDNHKVRTEIIHDALDEIAKLVSYNSETIRRLPQQYLYLENSDDLQIQLEHATGAQVERKKDSVILHVQTSESGNVCGLADNCVCPNQQTIKILPTSSWNFIDNKYAQRIFSFQDYGIVVDVITNTRSQSHICSATNSAQEYTSVNWISYPGGNVTGKPYSFPEHITGYVSDVKFFTLDGHVYVILAKMYDANHNTTHLDSLVLRIAKNKGQVETVQKLRTNGASTLHVFHTAQGVNLVIGNVGSQSGYEILTTDIYTFDRYSKLFELMRSIPSTGCSSATSVVLGYDSLIILAQTNNPVQVLKYNLFYKSYYFHESFLHEAPITSVSVFYTGGFGTSDAYLTAVTEKSEFYIYSYHYLIGWKMESRGEIDGLTALIPLENGSKQYLFAPSSTTTSSVLKIVKQGV